MMATWDDTNSSSFEKDEEQASNPCRMADSDKEEGMSVPR